MLMVYGMVEKMRALLKDEKGQGLAEYALILVLVSIAAIGAMTLLGDQIETVFGQIKAALIPAS